MKILVLFLVSFCVLVSSFSIKLPRSATEIFHIQVRAVIEELKRFDEHLKQKPDRKILVHDFIEVRNAYKRSSVLVDYFFPSLRKSINGPDLRYAEDDNPDVIHDPHGLQVIETLVYNEVNWEKLGKEVMMLIQTFESIDGQPELAYKLRDELMADAMKSSLIRLVAMGITGFDAPVSMNGIAESASVLDGLNEVADVIGMNELKKDIDDAKIFLVSAKTFGSFDRLTFIKAYADPLYGKITRHIISSNILLPDERRPINQYATSIYSDSLFQLDFFSPNERYKVTPLRVELGRSLFYDSIFSTTAKRSCASCHHPAKAFTDGLKTPDAIQSSVILKRNTPTLLNAVWQTKFFYDSRASTLENQLNAVVHNVDEMNGSLRESIERIRENDRYSKMFARAYQNDVPAVTEYNIANAISSYVRSLNALDTRFDRYMRGKGELTASEKKGFNLFTGKAKCATCHFMPLFNGLVPPFFSETESEVLGVPVAPGKKILDSDPGKYDFTKSTIHEHAFKTPTLRNIAQTAPYMHNGAFRTLEEVIEFYDKGGGAGLGMDVEHQTLPAMPLRLKKREKSNLIAFLKTLN